ncbi:MAG: hypothetical protein JO149_03955, partial [Gammaproteobacteria bacterium]|nr:hypothetical protein [Gammaproteobacteria bacterium]
RELFPNDWPAGIQQLITKGWDPNPKRRPTAGEALEMLCPPQSQSPVAMDESPPSVANDSVAKVRERSRSFSGKMASNHICHSRFFKKRVIHSEETIEKQEIVRKRMC